MTRALPSRQVTTARYWLDTVGADRQDASDIWLVGAEVLDGGRRRRHDFVHARRDSLPGKGVARIETSEKSHFFRVDVGQWDSIIDEFEQSVGAAS